MAVGPCVCPTALPQPWFMSHAFPIWGFLLLIPTLLHQHCLPFTLCLSKSNVPSEAGFKNPVTEQDLEVQAYNLSYSEV